MSPQLPGAVRPLLAFSVLLRENGYSVAPEQTTSFLQAVELLGPRSVEHLRQAAVATFAPRPEQRERFDALFDMHFLGARVEGGEQERLPGEDVSIQEGGTREVLIGEEVNESGRAATESEALSARRLREPDDAETLRRFGRDLPARLPRRRGYRRAPSRRGPTVDVARSLKVALRQEGEVMSLKRLRRTTRPRPLLLLIDVSGSMKERTDAHLALAYTVVHAARNVEVFTLGTRLTRVTRALRRRNSQQALAEAAGLVPDWDGGTRIGDALGAFLAVPRYGSFARGATVVILSDGLERGDPSPLIAAVQRLAARAHRIDWLSPLAGDPEFRPETQVLRAVRPFIDALADGSSTPKACRHILSIGGAHAA
jgi:uncharacterized protein with von Willebrand factor type A (vWA) domain